MPKLQHPTSGTVVDVSEARAETFRERGYSDLSDDTPNQSDTKDVWVAYAETQGYDPDDGLTKRELIDQYS